MMPVLNTPVVTPRMPFLVDFASGIISIGSCFADEVGSRLKEGFAIQSIIYCFGFATHNRRRAYRRD